MIGKISKYDKVNEIGYILGYDELTYFFHKNNVVKNEELKVEDIVSFDYLLEKNQNQLPYAINIVKEEHKEGKKSYKELYEIINCFPNEEKDKIPQSFMREIKNKMDISYEYRIEHIKDFENQVMLDETKKLLALVYRDYLATEEEKQEILKQEKIELENVERQKREKYNVDVYASKNNKKIDDDKIETETMAITLKEEKRWFKKLVDFIRKLFGSN